MAIRIPSLDDRTYEQLLELLRRQIAPGAWTDHNPSDPGMVLLEELCWLAEMALYRMDQVPDSHLRKFVDFLVDPPEPVTLDVTFTADFGAGSPDTLEIPAGTRIATDFRDTWTIAGEPVSFPGGRRFLFETFQPLTLTSPDIGSVDEGVVEARAILDVVHEPLGMSDGSHDQVFELRPPRHALGIHDPDTPLPVLVDFVHREEAAGGYDPNPRIEVDGIEWTAVSSLRTAESRVAVPGDSPHFMVERHENRIRFGDGVFGSIPAADAIIESTGYRVLDGPAALSVSEGDVVHVLNPPEFPDGTLTFVHDDAQGGASFFPASRRRELALSGLRAPYRLVTVPDFERAVLVDFNEFQHLSSHTPLIARASVVPDRRPPLSDGEPAPGFVTFVLLPGEPVFDTAVFRDEAVPVPTKQAMVELPPGVWKRVRRFLDRRRLITTRLRQQDTTLRALTLTAEVVVAGDRNLADMRDALRERIHRFLDPLSGGAGGRGWTLGRDVYRSQLYRLIEDAEGVDHVASLSLSPADGRGNVVIAAYELPLLQTLTLTTVKG